MILGVRAARRAASGGGDDDFDALPVDVDVERFRDHGG